MNSELLGKEIRARRLALGIRQQDLADLAEVSINTVVAVERGTGNPRLETLLSICQVLGLLLVTKLKGEGYETM